MKSLWNDESGAILSMELVLIATILVIGLVVGLSELGHAVANELNDVADAAGSLNQSYTFGGFSNECNNHPQVHCRNSRPGSAFLDRVDSCDGNECEISCLGAQAETAK